MTVPRERLKPLSRLFLLGAVHRDPAGKKRLLGALEDLKPNAISLEVSPASVELRRKWGRRWTFMFKERLAGLARETGLSPGRLMMGSALRGVYEYLRLPYEYRAAMEYARDHDRPVFLLDDSELAARYLNLVEREILSYRNMTLLAEAEDGTHLAGEVDAEYRRARNRLKTPETLPDLKVKNLEQWTAREAGLAQKLRLLHQGLTRRNGQDLAGRELVDSLIIAPDAVAYVPETVSFKPEVVHLYIGGWEHLVEDESGLGLYSHLKNLDPGRGLCDGDGLISR